MKVSERTQAPPQPVKEQVAQKLQGQESSGKLLQQIKEKATTPQQAPNPSHLGKNLDVKG